MTAPSRPFYASQDAPRCPDNITGDDGAPTRQRCGMAPATGYNPLGRCVEHLRRYRAATGSRLEVGEELTWEVGT